MKQNWNDSWLFTKDKTLSVTDWEAISLPHTWNAKDGQDGGNDYYRGTLATHHDGGYSTFRANITGFLQEENEILVAVDNAPNDRVYPQMADFTFYGGLYRDVNLICVPKAHFDLDYYGGPGITVTPIVEGDKANVEVVGYFTGLAGHERVTYIIKDGEQVVAEKTVAATEGKADFVIEKVHLWNGRKDPFLYTLEAVLTDGEKELDARTYGCYYCSSRYVPWYARRNNSRDCFVPIIL